MQILELTVENWGPYYDSHVIPLEVTPQAPIVLFKGENGRGKTSLLRAITWVLYGRLVEQNGRTEIPLEDMVNRDAVSDGIVPFGVTLRYTHDGKTMRIARTGEIRHALGRTSVVRTDLTLLDEASGAVPQGQIAATIERMISRDIADFFFFDGEMLIRFEEKLRDDASTTRFVREQVEKALGLPFLKALGEDLEVLQRALGEEVNRATRGNARATKIREDLERFDGMLEVFTKDKERLTTDLAGAEAAIAALDLQMEGADEARAMFHERKAAERELQDDLTAIEDRERDMRDIAETSWWFPLAARISARQEEDADLLLAESGRNEERIELSIRLKHLDVEIESEICPTCGQVLPEDTRKGLTAERELVRASLAAMDSVNLGTEDLRLRMQELRPYTSGDGVRARLDDLNQDLRLARFRRDRRRARIAEISSLLEGSALEIGEIETQLQRRKIDVANITMALSKIEADESLLLKGRSQALLDLAKLPGLPPLASTRLRVYGEALGVVKNSFDGFRFAMRQTIEREATEIFLSLSAEKDYKGVRLNEDYSLSVLDQDGTPEKRVSAGYNQILTMSFIGALSRASVEEAPMVMDTPLGRLDRSHRKAIMEWVASMNSQVILFVQSGEYDAVNDRALLGTRVGREYEIRRLGAKRSEVVVG